MDAFGKDRQGTIEVVPCPTCGKEVSQFCRFEPDYRRIRVKTKYIRCACGREVVSYGTWDDAITEWNWRASGRPSEARTPKENDRGTRFTREELAALVIAKNDLTGYQYCEYELKEVRKTLDRMLNEAKADGSWDEAVEEGNREAQERREIV